MFVLIMYFSGTEKTNANGGKFRNGCSYPPEKKEEVYKLKDAGMRNCDIAERLKIARSTVTKFLRERKLKAGQNEQ